ncbi:oxidoreductase [Propionivibrio dicarboxylicus]|uniref:Uncharacterized oxidoreductase n=1 Tax=Propionivibrio dicarboxylicus TaxID=83767 RepID=A0A1G7XTY6_9RHOO|nr:oxidoreductase [Propionivibrio dicarboxylicus]SDG87668.1 uncharacterized oxidoreductase [Propionivibrio dicarboxylicus]
MNESDGIRVQPGAANYFSYEGALGEIERFFPAERLGQVLWIGGRRALEAAAPYLPALYQDSRSRRKVFAGHCSEREVAAYVEEGRQADLVIGVGGGSVLDTAKAVAHRLQRPFVAVPTIAATCAAWTPLSVWYDDDGRALGYELFPLASQLVLVEPRLLAAAPPDYLRAGIGDTLAKWYEARVLCDAESVLPLTASIGLSVAAQIRDVLLVDGASAVPANTDGLVTPALVRVIDAVIAGGGLVGGLGERFTRLAAAHSVHNGLTVVAGTERFLHGAKVAYGILVQLALEKRQGELLNLYGALGALGLPRRLSDLGVDPHDENGIAAFVAHTLRAQESIHFLPGAVDAERLRAALFTVESLSPG